MSVEKGADGKGVVIDLTKTDRRVEQLKTLGISFSYFFLYAPPGSRRAGRARKWKTQHSD